jgi:hypothetical protein
MESKDKRKTKGKRKEKAMINSPTFDGPCLFRSHMTSSPFRELVNILLENAICTVVVMISPHRFLDASRRYPAREVVDIWEGPIPAGTGVLRRRIRRRYRLRRSGWTGVGRRRKETKRGLSEGLSGH